MPNVYASRFILCFFEMAAKIDSEECGGGVNQVPIMKLRGTNGSMSCNNSNNAVQILFLTVRVLEK